MFLLLLIESLLTTTFQNRGFKQTAYAVFFHIVIMTATSRKIRQRRRHAPSHKRRHSTVKKRVKRTVKRNQRRRRRR